MPPVYDWWLFTLQAKGKHFKAVHPNILLEKQDEISSKLKSLVPNLSSLISSDNSNTSTAVYEGLSGFKTAFKKIIEDCSSNETIKIIGFSEKMYVEKSLRIFIQNMNLKSAEKNEELKILLGENVKQTFGKDRERESNTTVKYLPKGYVSPVAIDVFKDYIYIFIWEDTPFVFMIKNKAVAKSFESYFDFLWAMSKE